jgi:hypothetical protein
MTKFIATLISLALFSAGCASAPSTSTGAANQTDLIPLEDAKSLIASGQVKEIFQPHLGCVILIMRDGRYLSFDQPHLDWVLDYVRDNGLESKVDGISVE